MELGDEAGVVVLAPPWLGELLELDEAGVTLGFCTALPFDELGELLVPERAAELFVCESVVG